MTLTPCTFSSLDGTQLSGDYINATGTSARSVLLVHGAGVDRHEDGFYDRATEVLSNAGLGVMRFDLRCHGGSQSCPQGLTIAGALNDVLAAWAHVERFTKALPVGALGSSFGGGLLALAGLREVVPRMVLINPLLKFRKRFLEDKPFWTTNGLDDKARVQLWTTGSIAHFGGILMNDAFINEALWLDPFDLVQSVGSEVLICHGTSDSKAPFAVAQAWAEKVGGHLLPFQGAEHGLCVPGDEDFAAPLTLEWQKAALLKAAAWFTQLPSPFD